MNYNEMTPKQISNLLQQQGLHKLAAFLQKELEDWEKRLAHFKQDFKRQADRIAYLESKLPELIAEEKAASMERWQENQNRLADRYSSGKPRCDSDG